MPNSQPTSPVRCKNLRDICCISPGISLAHFVLNVVAIATRVGRGKLRLAAFDAPFPKTPEQMPKNLTDISYTSQVIANSVTNVVDMATGLGQGEN